MNINTNVPWTPFYPYGPIWYLINFPALIYGWTLPYQIEVYSMIAITGFIMGLYQHYKMGLFYITIAILFIQSGQAYLISSLSLLGLGVINPMFTVLSIFDRLPLGTSFDFSHNGSWTERTHFERYVLFGSWFLIESFYWIRKGLRDRKKTLSLN